MANSSPSILTCGRTYAKINLTNAVYNFNLVKKATKSKICCVVKADAYGHGAIPLARLYQKLKADYLAVATVDEGVALRLSNIFLPILILGYTPAKRAKDLYRFNLTQTVFSLPYAKMLASELKELGIKISVHVKVDTGMNRIGFKTDKKSIQEIYQTCKMPCFLVQGIFTHFNCADQSVMGKDITYRQFEKFKHAINSLEYKGVYFKIKHCCNSAGVFDYPEFCMDMVRVGIVLYGLKPSKCVKNLPPLKPVMTLVSTLTQIKRIDKNESVGYGGSFVANKKLTLATLPIGYADGLVRTAKNYSVLINGKLARIVGNICMDQTMVDASKCKCKVGDEAIIFGEDESCNAEILADHLSSISYEVTCGISSRVPRIYTREN